jgi:prevent-host-death family protein
MRSIGVRELKAHTSEILREVREHGAEYTVTHRGRAVARLVPAGRPLPPNVAEVDAWLAEMDAMAAEIDTLLPEGSTLENVLGDMRRER